MLVYDSTTIAFIQKAEAILKEILTKVGISVCRSRFELNNRLYPINVVAFEGQDWGHFVPAYYQIGLNRKLTYSAKDSVVRDILKHELAHYLTFILHGTVSAHGREFKQLCEDFGFPPDVASATMNLDLSNLAKEGDLASERILSKVKKLFELASSSNTHEAELATLKANQLLLRHNLDYLKDPQAPVYLNRILIQPRKDAKIVAIYDILKHFIVKTVLSHGKDTCSLEVSGTHTNVTLASYVAEFLNRELDQLWATTKVEHNLSGLRAKNSFFHGVAMGFDEKMSRSLETLNPEDKRALVVVQKQLTFDTQVIYKRLRSSRSSRLSDAEATAHGFVKGHSLTIRNAVEGKGKNLYLTKS
ncbi:MAG TPA: DUF2786 domain-containing protein [Bacteriovoracaceae bacterium]|nr:DUF2786 domain-containing protein [Bacteriovoracaceae bacterium]